MGLTTNMHNTSHSSMNLGSKSESIFHFALELLPTGLLVIDCDRNIRIANRALEKMFGYDEGELNGKLLDVLLPESFVGHHIQLVDEYLQNPTQDYAMAAGRMVRAVSKNGDLVWVDIRLSVHEFEGEKHAFASVVDLKSNEENRAKINESSNRIRRAIDAVQDGVWEWNLSSGVVWFSSKMVKILGINTDTEYSNIDSWLDHVHPDYIEDMHAAIEQHLLGDTSFDMEYLGKTENGDYQWMYVRGNAIFNELGSPTLFSGTLSNINARKNLEFQLEEQSNFLNAVLEKSLSGMYLFNLKGQVNTFINQQYTEITGYTLENLNELQENGQFMSLFHDEDLGKLSRHLDDVLQDKGKMGVPLEYRFKHKNGQWIWCYSRDSIYSYDESGEPKEMLGTFFDITELKSREAQIAILAKDYFITFEQAPVGIAHVDTEGNWKKTNKTLRDILGYSADELRATLFQKVQYSDTQYADFEMMKRYLADGAHQYSSEKQFIKVNGEVIWVNLTVSVAQDETEEVTHYICIIEDISERKRIEKSLAESNKALERFAYSASHDLQEPLRKISTFTDCLKDRLEGVLDDPDAKYELNKVIESSKRMREMIDSLLLLSRYSRQKINREKTKLSEVIRCVEEDLSEPIEFNSTEIKLMKELELNVDFNCFQVLFRNLISNSIRYRKKTISPRIVIDHEMNTMGIVITYKDNSVGFEEEFNEQIFEPFRRLVGKSVKGHGMGLALCKQIVEAHDGKIFAKGKPMEGAVFTILLPYKSGVLVND